MRIDMNTVENAVFQGGSVKGIAYLGALKALEERQWDRAQLKRVGGTSAGAITATLLALGYSLKTLKKEQEDLDFKELLDETSGTTREFLLGTAQKVGESNTVSGKVAASSSMSLSHPSQASRVSSRVSSAMGIYDGEYLRQWLVKHIWIQTGEQHLTFLDLHQQHLENPKKFKDLFVTGVNLSTGYTEVFNYLKTPNVIVADAVRISLSIPLLFKPHTRYIKNTEGKRELAQPEDVYTDGGILDNYPIHLFDYHGFVDNLPEDATTFWQPQHNTKTVGFRLVSKAHKDYFEGEAEAETQKVDAFIPYCKALYHTIMNKQNSDHQLRHDKTRTIYIDHQGIDTLAFDLTDEQKECLLKAGYQAVEAWYAQAQEESKESKEETLESSAPRPGLF